MRKNRIPYYKEGLIENKNENTKKKEFKKMRKNIGFDKIVNVITETNAEKREVSKDKEEDLWKIRNRECIRWRLKELQLLKKRPTVRFEFSS